MADKKGVESRVLLKRLRNTLAEAGEGQERLDRITTLIASSLVAEVCSIYLRRDETTLELCATEGLKKEAVHETRMRVGEGLVGIIAETATPINVPDAPSMPGFRYMPETGEERYSSFLGVPIQRLGEVLGVLVIQNKASRNYTEDEVYGLEVVAMVIAEMTELGAFTGPGSMAMAAPHRRPFFARGVVGQEGVAEGVVYLHEAQIVISNPVADDPASEKARLHEAMEVLRRDVDEMLATDAAMVKGEHREVLETFRMFAHDKGWLRRMEDGIDSGLAAEVAVEKEQSATRTRMARVPDPYLRERLHDLDDLSNRLLRILTGRGADAEAEIPRNAILVARNIGPGELLDYGSKIRGVVLEEGSVGSHAAIVARALAIPLVIQAPRITREALNGDPILVDGDQGLAHLRPEESVIKAFREKIAMNAQAAEVYTRLRDRPARSRDDVTVSLCMNAGLMADLPSLKGSGAEGVGLYRTELQFLLRASVPRRSEQADLYSRVLDAADGRPVTFRTLDIGSDKVLPYMRRTDEPNPAMGWRAIRLGLDRGGVMRMQLQALLRGAKGRPLNVMFPFVAQMDEFIEARKRLLDEVHRERSLGHVTPELLRIGAMLETPSLAYAPDRFFRMVDFLSIGGNDLKQFFFAADRENERVRRRYDTLNVSFLTFIEHIAKRCDALGTPVSFCGEDAGRPIDALAFVAMGLRNLSMRPASIGPVKHLLRRANIADARAVIDRAISDGAQSVRPALSDYIRNLPPLDTPD
ncbi:phosphoenolpyruvate--protein phosphotransferase [Oceanomicrobium pacificus]|uniref:phosphoenolpyruvate--protein phosphotransferase n=1 Tax=Oceanomicrobium pacificus TaxID=2692916 RepID=A0A6B0U106_9RHOB|nr:phosphoenolpyruvate--protein phosphotransferase [Oceanomicrobium pacificus]MXU66864.1 phosphoenolpyruvate--protein phosphotransferase [Oceanomicrobium pacificus]